MGANVPLDRRREALLAGARRQYRRIIGELWAIVEQSEATMPGSDERRALGSFAHLKRTETGRSSLAEEGRLQRARREGGLS
jgi:hypothetical protein